MIVMIAAAPLGNIDAGTSGHKLNSDPTPTLIKATENDRDRHVAGIYKKDRNRVS